LRHAPHITKRGSTHQGSPIGVIKKGVPIRNRKTTVRDIDHLGPARVESEQGGREESEKGAQLFCKGKKYLGTPARPRGSLIYERREPIDKLKRDFRERTSILSRGGLRETSERIHYFETSTNPREPDETLTKKKKRGCYRPARGRRHQLPRNSWSHVMRSASLSGFKKGTGGPPGREATPGTLRRGKRLLEKNGVKTRRPKGKTTKHSGLLAQKLRQRGRDSKRKGSGEARSQQNGEEKGGLEKITRREKAGCWLKEGGVGGRDLGEATFRKEPREGCEGGDVGPGQGR